MSCNDTFEMSTREALETWWLGFLLGANHKLPLSSTYQSSGVPEENGYSA